MNRQKEIDRAVAGPLASVADQVRCATLPSLRLERTKWGSRHSHIGGAPDLPSGTPWPEWRGRALGFLAQIDLAELPRVERGGDALPQRGLLAFFFDVDPQLQPWGFDPDDAGSARVIYTPQGCPTVRATPPAEVAPDELYRPGKLIARIEPSLPERETLAALAPGFEGDLADAYLDLLLAMVEGRGERGRPLHRMLGYPDQIQMNDMQTECQLASNGIYVGDPTGYEDPRAAELRDGARDWILLLQLSSERGMAWDDDGCLYFWARASDLRAGRFERTWAILQSG